MITQSECCILGCEDTGNSHVDLDVGTPVVRRLFFCDAHQASLEQLAAQATLIDPTKIVHVLTLSKFARETEARVTEANERITALRAEVAALRSELDEVKVSAQ